ncbi:DNA methylase [Escherichia coli]|nr:DNA methylase [Escherichia coli]
MTIKSNTPAHDKDCWQTPLWLFDALDIEFGFWLDSAASDKNALCAHWLTEADDAFNSEWVHKASPVELRTSIEMAHSLAQIGVRFVPIPVETDEEFHTLAASLSQKLEMMVAKAEADERDQV